MDGTAKQLNTDSASIYRAEVKSILDGKYLLADRYGRIIKARKAVSCLTMPEVGDTALAVDAGGDGAFVLAILTRQRGTASTLTMEGDVQLSVPSGKLNITAGEGISIGTSNELSLIANKLGLTGETLLAAFHKFNLLGTEADVNLTDIKLFSKRLRSRIESAIGQFVTRHAKVEGLDNVSAGSIKQTARELLNLHSMFTFMKAKKNVKIDGKQIFMG